MKQTQNSRSILMVNLIAGLAVVVSLFPFGGELPDKPAGVRNAIELMDKRSGGLKLVSEIGIADRAQV